MAQLQRKRRRRVEDMNPLSPRGPAGTLHAWAWEYLEDLRVRQRTPASVLAQAKSFKVFFRWCEERSLSRPEQVSRQMLERFQRQLFYARKKDGQPLAVRTQYQHLNVLRLFFRWLARQRHIESNPAAELLMPRLAKRLPQAVLSLEEVEIIFAQPKLSTPDGMRDRAMLELLYSTGLRRSELAALKLFDIDVTRGTVWVRLGKGRKDRVVPVTERAQAWLQRYIEEMRPKLASGDDEGFVFIGDAGEPLVPDYLTHLVRHYMVGAGLKKPGSCHLFRHSMATAMLDGGADVRFVQEMLGHASLSTTEVYTRVSIEKLKAVHAATHPAARLTRGVGASPGDDQPAAQKELASKRGPGGRAELLEELAADGEDVEPEALLE